MGQGTRFALELFAQTGDVVVLGHAAVPAGGVDMRIDDGVAEVADLKADFLRDDLCQCGVAGEIERNAERDVAAALGEMAVEPVALDIEDEAVMAGREFAG